MQNSVIRRTKPVAGFVCALVLLTASGLLHAQRGQLRPKRDPRPPGTLRVGKPAPDFTLKTKDGSREVQLSSFKGERPVVIIFGSYT